jgi:hypothetical protein
MGLSRNIDGQVRIHWTMEDAERADRARRERFDAQIRRGAQIRRVGWIAAPRRRLFTGARTFLSAIFSWTSAPLRRGGHL